MRDQPRPRHRVSPTTLTLLKPFFRFSAARDAYVLRLAGGRVGPVLVDRTIAPPRAEPPAGAARVPRTGRFAREDAAEPAARQTRKR